jgi:hypothetical protein
MVLKFLLEPKFYVHISGRKVTGTEKREEGEKKCC